MASTRARKNLFKFVPLENSDVCFKIIMLEPPDRAMPLEQGTLPVTIVAVQQQALRVTSFVVYLASWLALAIVAVLGALPRRGQSRRNAP